MAAKFVVFIAFLALVNAAMVRRDAPTQADSDLESVLEKSLDSVRQQLSDFSSSFRNPLIEITDGSGNVVSRRQYRDTADKMYSKVAMTTMSDKMQQDAIDCATRALTMFNNNKDVAQFIADEFDKKYNPSWNCIVGLNLGCSVSSERKHFALFSVGQVAILLFRSG